jgi:hypothetical protein
MRAETAQLAVRQKRLGMLRGTRRRTMSERALPRASVARRWPCASIGHRRSSLRAAGLRGLVRPRYQGDGCGRSRDVRVVRTSPPARVLPVGRRPIRARLPRGVSDLSFRRTRWIKDETFSSSCLGRVDARAHTNIREKNFTIEHFRTLPSGSRTSSVRGSQSHKAADCTDSADGANGIRTRDLLRAKSPRAVSAVGRIQVSCVNPGLRRSCRSAEGRFAGTRASKTLPLRAVYERAAPTRS